jgi:putative hydroxymethylpyrimidine transporter CytX
VGMSAEAGGLALGGEETSLGREYSVVEQVPMEGRHYSWIDMFLTWIGANANTGSWFIGGLAASIGLAGAFWVILLSNPPAYLIVALIGFMGFKVGTTTMSLTRASLGIRGSQAASWLNLLQYVGWSVVGSYIGAISLSFIFADWFGMVPFGQPGADVTLTLGILIISALQAVIVVVGGSHSIRWAERVGVTALTILGIWATWAVLTQWDLAAIGNWQPPAGVALPQGVVVDIFAIYSVTWFPAVAEFTRFTRTRQAATTAPFLGATIAIFWFALIGVLATIAGALATGTFDPVYSDPSSVLSQLGLGAVAFLVLVLATLSTNVIDIYVAGFSIVNLRPKVSIVRAFIICSVLATVFAFAPMLIGGLVAYLEAFLTLIGAVFGPIAAIMIVDFFLLRGQHYDWSQADKVNGLYWYTNGFNWPGIVTWVIGAATYVLLMGITIGEFVVAATFPLFIDNIGGFYPTMIVSAVAYYVLSMLAGQRQAPVA